MSCSVLTSGKRAHSSQNTTFYLELVLLVGVIRQESVQKLRENSTFRVFPGPFYCSRGPSLVELTGDNDSATSTVAVIRMSLKENAWPSHILSIIAEYGSTAGEVANSARGQLNRENKYFPVCLRSRLGVWSRETRSAVRSRVSLLILQTQAESSAY